MSLMTARCALAAIVFLVITGCGSTNAPGDAGRSSQVSAPSRSVKPSQAFGPTQSEGIIDKKIGEPAGLNCSEDPAEPCDLNFNVTAIQQDATCDAATDPPGAGQQFLRFDIEAFSSDGSFEFQDSQDALLLPHWSVDATDGASLHDLTSYSGCGTGAAPIREPVVPGAHARATVVVRAPKPASALRLSWLDLTWAWVVPGAD